MANYPLRLLTYVSLLLVALINASCFRLSPVPFSPVSTQETIVSTLPLGIQIPDHLKTETVLPALADMGARWARLNVFWRQLEPRRTLPPTYRWNSLDQTLQALTAVNLKLVLTLRDNPPWAAETLCGPLNEEGMQGLAQLLQALVSRYAEPPYQVKYWELYNEPDNGNPQQYEHYGGCWGHHSEAYVSMLKTAYESIKAADPEAIVLIGGVAYEDFDANLFVADFLDQVLDAGGGRYFDMMNYHYYPAFADVWNRYGQDLAGKADYLRSELARYGLQKPLAITEVGQPTSGPSADRQSYSDERTARYVVQAMVRGASAHLEMVIWFTLVDNPEDVRKYGLLREDGTRKLAYEAYRVLAEQLGTSRFVRALPSSLLRESSLEGYEFTTNDDTRWVVWSNDNRPATLVVESQTVKVVNLYGKVFLLQDGRDGDDDRMADGRITLSIGPEPRYLIFP